MDVLDAAILRQLGVEPFAGFDERPRGLRATDVSRSLGRSVRLVQDRITKMERDGVISGYALVPNPRHLGMALTTFYVPTDGAADEAALARLAGLDGFVMAIAYLGTGACLSMAHRSTAERERRLGLAQAALSAPQPPRSFYEHSLPEVGRALTSLDWRIIAALAPDARRAVAEVAAGLGVSVKTVRQRLNRMRDEGSIDEVARLDFRRMDGVMPFELAVWCDDPASVRPRLVERLREHMWMVFTGARDGYCDLLLRVFATNPQEAHRVVQAAASVRGVARAEALMAAGAHKDDRWLREAVEAKVAPGSA